MRGKHPFFFLLIFILLNQNSTATAKNIAVSPNVLANMPEETFIPRFQKFYAQSKSSSDWYRLAYAGNRLAKDNVAKAKKLSELFAKWEKGGALYSRMLGNAPSKAWRTSMQNFVLDNIPALKRLEYGVTQLRVIPNRAGISQGASLYTNQQIIEGISSGRFDYALVPGGVYSQLKRAGKAEGLYYFGTAHSVDALHFYMLVSNDIFDELKKKKLILTENGQAKTKKLRMKLIRPEVTLLDGKAIPEIVETVFRNRRIANPSTRAGSPSIVDPRIGLYVKKLIMQNEKDKGRPWPTAGQALRTILKFASPNITEEEVQSFNRLFRSPKYFFGACMDPKDGMAYFARGKLESFSGRGSWIGNGLKPSASASPHCPPADIVVLSGADLLTRNVQQFIFRKLPIEYKLVQIQESLPYRPDVIIQRIGAGGRYANWKSAAREFIKMVPHFDALKEVSGAYQDLPTGIATLTEFIADEPKSISLSVNKVKGSYLYPAYVSAEPNEKIRIAVTAIEQCKLTLLSKTRTGERRTVLRTFDRVVVNERIDHSFSSPGEYALFLECPGKKELFVKVNIAYEVSQDENKEGTKPKPDTGTDTQDGSKPVPPNTNPGKGIAPPSPGSGKGYTDDPITPGTDKDSGTPPKSGPPKTPTPPGPIQLWVNGQPGTKEMPTQTYSTVSIGEVIRIEAKGNDQCEIRYIIWNPDGLNFTDKTINYFSYSTNFEFKIKSEENALPHRDVFLKCQLNDKEQVYWYRIQASESSEPSP